MRCIEDEIDGDTANCAGEVDVYTSRSGETRTARCAHHADAHERRMDQVDAGLQQRYPGWDNPHSSPPHWFDPANAGEHW